MHGTYLITSNTTPFTSHSVWLSIQSKCPDLARVQELEEELFHQRWSVWVHRTSPSRPASCGRSTVTLQTNYYPSLILNKSSISITMHRSTIPRVKRRGMLNSSPLQQPFRSISLSTSVNLPFVSLSTSVDLLFVTDTTLLIIAMTGVSFRNLLVTCSSQSSTKSSLHTVTKYLHQ